MEIIIIMMAVFIAKLFIWVNAVMVFISHLEDNSVITGTAKAVLIAKSITDGNARIIMINLHGAKRFIFLSLQSENNAVMESTNPATMNNVMMETRILMMDVITGVE